MMSVRYNYNTCPKKDSEVSGVGWGCLIIQGIRTGSPVQAAFRQLDERCEDGRGVFWGKGTWEEGTAGVKVQRWEPA